MPGMQEILSSESAGKAAGFSGQTQWQRALSQAIRDLPTLLSRLNLPQDLAGALAPEDSGFPLLVPESYLRRMQPGDPQDPLLLQVLPVASELINPPEFVDDPVGDEFARAAPGLLQKYNGRALLIAHGSCAVNCRYCFRRHYPYGEQPKSLEDWEPALQAIQQDETVNEVILSGGDPLILSDRKLKVLFSRLEKIPHLRRLRIHSRIPIVLPERMNEELLSMLSSLRLQTVMVVHANHPRELTGDCAGALEQMKKAGLMMLNQAVLLRGVNDRLEILAELCERCVDVGVLPYYLHQLDRVRGASHFEVPVETGRELVLQLRARLPGYAVPRYVLEVPGRTSKTALL